MKNLIKVFQLDSVSAIKLDLPEEQVDTSLDDVFSTAITSSRTFGSLTKTGMRDMGNLKTLATLGSRGFDGSTLQPHTHRTTRLALSEIFNNNNPTAPPPTPAKPISEDRDVGPSLEDGRKAMALLHALLPMAAHLIPLPTMGDDELEEVSLIDLETEVGGSSAEGESSAGVEDGLEKAREDLVRELEEGDLEIIVSIVKRQAG